jgi:hypothetical protein
MDREKEVLRTYNKIWGAPFKIYSIDGMKLIVPISPWDVVYYGIGVLLMILLDYIYPGNIIFVYKYILIPILLRFLLVKVKLDGKKPHNFLVGMIRYLITSKKKEYFRPLRKPVLKTFEGSRMYCKVYRGVKK